MINVVTRAADPLTLDDQPTGSIGITLGNYNQVIVDADITGKLSDTVGASLSGYSNTRDGYFDNLVSGSELNERDRYGLRGELVFAPSDDLTIRAIADYDVIDENVAVSPTSSMDRPERLYSLSVETS